MPKSKITAKLLLLVLTLSILVTPLASCKKSEYVAETKEEIAANITEDFSSTPPQYSFVYRYLKEWGVPSFDANKFYYFESVLSAVYNYGNGAPEAAEHARLTAVAFIEKYYDAIDKSDKTAVTDALLDCYVSVLGDPYSVYRPPVESDDYFLDMSGKFGGIGVVVEYDYTNELITVNTVYIDSPAEKAGIEVGDIIHAVNGVTVTELGLENAVYHIRGEIGTAVKLTLIRGDAQIEVEAVRAEVEEINCDYSFDETTKFGYIRIVSFKRNTFDQFASAINELEKLGAVGYIFDLRGNPGGYLSSVCDVVSYLVPTGKTVVTYKYKNRLPESDVTKDDLFDGVKSDHTVTLPIVVLCDEYTASSGEIFTSAVRDYRDAGILNARIVGTTTYGKGIMQNSYSYTDNSTITLTVAYYDPPCGINYHGIGIAPDVVVNLPTPEIDPETGKYIPVEDTQLDAAIKELEMLVNANNK